MLSRQRPVESNATHGMSDLSPLEKRRLQQFLGMASGYVLDFTNRTFAEFITHSTGRDIYDPRYDNGSGSKANRLRAFWQKEENGVVGKLTGDMLDYSEGTGAQLEVYRLIVARLMQRGSDTGARSVAQENTESAQQKRRSEGLRELKDCFLELAADRDRNRAGLALEKLLNRLFEAFTLQPRQPFRVVGEQIDGSFQLDGHIYLLESKWKSTSTGSRPARV